MHAATVRADAARAPGLRDRYQAAMTWEEFVRDARTHGELWRAISARAAVPADLILRAVQVSAPRHLLVLTEDWCGDGVNTLPPVAKLAETIPQLDLRVLARDENPDLMDAHLTNGSRSIPVVLVLDEQYRERGWWGPRPAALQEWVRTDGQRLSKEERYKEVRRWYARDRGRATLGEIISLLERTADPPTAAFEPASVNVGTTLVAPRTDQIATPARSCRSDGPVHADCPPP
jgi:hypothetical protein